MNGSSVDLMDMLRGRQEVDADQSNSRDVERGTNAEGSATLGEYK